MALWQIRLGGRGELEKDKMGKCIPDFREYLAHDHSLITISYAIEKDITNMGTEEIAEYIEKLNKKFETRSRAVSAYIRQILNFKNGINKGDYVISPFHCLEDGDKAIIGIVTGEFGTLESLFEGNLDSFLKEHNKDINKCRNFPTRKVKWLTKTFNRNDIHAEIIPQLKHGDGIGTVAKLRFSGQTPTELTQAKVFLSTSSTIYYKLIKLVKNLPSLFKWLGVTFGLISFFGGVTTGIKSIIGVIKFIQGYLS